RSCPCSTGARSTSGRRCRSPLDVHARALWGCACAPTETLSRPGARVCVASVPTSRQAPPGRSARSFEESGLPLADADTKCRHPVAPATAAKLVQQGDDEARAAHPERMAERDRAAVHVHLLRIQTELADDDEALRGKRLVQLDQVEVGC